MFRCFNNVGQGAFYTETFRGNVDKHIVYDCGSTKKATIIKKIEQTFGRGEEIECVFISHLHDDHVNGLEHLLNYCKVKRLYLPLLRKESKILSLLYLLANNVSSSSFLYRLTLNAEKIVGERTQVFYVREYNKEYVASEYRDNERVEYINSGEERLLNGFNWQYVPFNYKSDIMYKELIDMLSKKMITVPALLEDVPEFYKNNAKQLKAIYKSVTGDINMNSLVVYSGPKEVYSFEGCYYLSCVPHFSYRLSSVGCLYTGDYDASGVNQWDELKNCYSLYWRYIGTWQIPHHGSKSNYNRQISQSAASTAIISAGRTNRYGHPHNQVTRDILLSGMELHIVTEDSFSQAQFMIIGKLK